jgi:hypothetical protein
MHIVKIVFLLNVIQMAIHVWVSSMNYVQLTGGSF